MLHHIATAEEGAVGNPSVGRWGQSYTLDPWGNLTQQTTAKGTIPSFSTSVAINSSIVGCCGACPERSRRNAAGNRTQNGSATFTWDAESRLTSSVGAGGTTNYTYDANGMRVRKQTGSNWTEYIYFGSEVIAEKDQDTNWTDYIYAGGKRVAKAPGVAATSGTEFYHGDHLGSARLMTNASGGVVANSEATYLPFGQQYETAVGTNHYKFTGKERDAESNLDYFGARYYAATQGRWMTPDWSEEPEPVPYADLNDPQTLNLYGYVGNRPITNVDADGHCFWDLCVVETAVAVTAVAALATVLASPQGQKAIETGITAAGVVADRIGRDLHDGGTIIFNKVTGNNNPTSDGVGVKAEGEATPPAAGPKASGGPKAKDAPGVTAGGQATDKSGNKLGPSGEKQINKTRSTTREGAGNKARSEGSGAVEHRNPQRGKRHFHTTDAKGKKKPSSTHHEY